MRKSAQGIWDGDDEGNGEEGVDGDGEPSLATSRALGLKLKLLLMMVASDNAENDENW